MGEKEEKVKFSPLGTWAQRERRYIVEWYNKNYAGIRVKFNAAIGPVPSEIIKEMGFERAVRAYKPMRKKIDCLIFDTTKLIAAEAEIVAPLNAIRDIIFYRDLLKDSPDLGEWMNKPHEMVLVMPYKTEEVERLCKRYDIRLDIFKPAWIDEYLEERRLYWTKEGELQRMERKRRLGKI
jgi:hypothetical protein